MALRLSYAAVKPLTVQNLADFPLKYEIDFKEENSDGVPMEFRLKNSGGYLTDGWTKAAKLADVREELSNNSKTAYTLEWRWNYNGNDKLDTAVGGGEAPYVLKISYTAEQNGEAVSAQRSDNRSAQTDERSPNTGGSSPLPFCISLIFCFGMTMLLMLLLQRENDDEEDEEETEEAEEA